MRARVKGSARRGTLLRNVIEVPRRGSDCISKLSIRRRAVTSPSFGSPVGVVPPIAASKSAMPGPLSTIADGQRCIASAFLVERELDASAAAVPHGVARDFGHGGCDAHLVLRVEVEQRADLPRALAGRDHVAIVRELQLQQCVSHDVVARRSTTTRQSSRPRLQSRYSTPAIVAQGCCIRPG